MKKFLTVLLALSVVFTYTVGTAFADGTPNEANAYEQAKAEQTRIYDRVDGLAKAWINDTTNYAPGQTEVQKAADIKFHVVDPQGGSYFFTVDGTKKVAQDALNALNAKLGAEVNKVSSDDAKLAEALNKMAEYETACIDSLDDLIMSLGADVVEKKVVTYAKEAYVAFVNTYKAEDYSAALNEDGTVNREIIEEAKAEAIVAINNAISAFWGENNTEDAADAFYNTVKGIPTTDKQEDADKTLAESKEYAITIIESEIESEKAFEKADWAKWLNGQNSEIAKEILARLDADFDALVKGATYEVNYCKTSDAVTNVWHKWDNNLTNERIYTYGSDAKPTDALKAYVDKADRAAELEALAAEMKAKTGFNGTPLYDADAIDVALAADIKAVYTGEGSDNALETLERMPNEDLLKYEMKRVLGYFDNEIKVNGRKYAAVDQWGKNKQYDDEKLAELEAIITETEDAIKAAKSIEDVDAAFVAGYEKYVTVKTITDLNKYLNSAAGITALEKYEAKLDAEFIAKRADYGTDKFDADYDVVKNTFLTNLSNDYLKTAYTTTEMAEKYADALKEIENLKNKAELTAEAEAINTAFRALPAAKDLTLADEETLLTLAKRIDDFDAYKELIGVTGYPTVSTTTMDAYMDKMAKLAKEELKKAYDAIGTVTVEDEAAIDEFAAKVKAYDDNYTPASGYADKVKELYAKLTDAKVAAVEKAIGAIDASADPLDVDAIKAAREAYDALGEVTISSTMYHKLLSLENLAKDYMIQAVKSLKVVKNHSVAGKGYIKIAWSTIGDDSVVDGYRVYRSTKKDIGYGAKPIFTTTGKTYKNTKSLKKGTRYYYKVRAYKVVDGKTYFSAYSNKAHRVAK